MHSTLLRRPIAAQNLADLAPLGATILLTAAIFLLPAAGQQGSARATIDDIKVSASHIAYVGAANRSAAHE